MGRLRRLRVDHGGTVITPSFALVYVGNIYGRQSMTAENGSTRVPLSSSGTVMRLHLRPDPGGHVVHWGALSSTEVLFVKPVRIGGYFSVPVLFKCTRIL